MLLASLDADFTVVDPPEFRDYLQACAGRFLRAASRLDRSRPSHERHGQHGAEPPRARTIPPSCDSTEDCSR